MKKMIDGVPEAPAFQEYLRPRGKVYSVLDEVEEPLSSSESHRLEIILKNTFNSLRFRGHPVARHEFYDIYVYHEKIGKYQVALAIGDPRGIPDLSQLAIIERDDKPYFVVRQWFQPLDHSIRGPLETAIVINSAEPGSSRLQRLDSYAIPFAGERR